MTLKLGEKHYDAIVVGAGPAGSSAARKAAELGVKVLIIDRKRDIGYPIQCGELVPTIEEFPKILPRAKRAEKLFNLPKWVISNICSRVAVIGPSKKIYEFKFSSNILDRSRFDKWLVMNATKAGAELWTCCNAIGVENDGKEVLVKKEGKILRLKADVLVAADGPSSNMVKDIGLSSSNPNDLAVTIEYLMGGVEIDSDLTEVYFGKEYAPGGYAWIIPKGEGMANVGLGIRTSFSERGVSLKDYLERFINKHPIASKKFQKGVILSRTGGLIPVGGPIKKTYSENAIVVGDAAGQVMATNGGGIPPAVICGDIGGEAIAKKLRGESDLSFYEKEWKSEVGKELDAGVKIRKIVDIALRSDRLADTIFGVLDGKIVEEVIRCRLSMSLNLLYKTVESLRRSLNVLK
ncbi:MAG: NAD(P)/FAD-dependent oxidoreductase [archaeon]|nr:NAD(P)/FAD-dependent oxidoreductase [archaeon]